MERTIQLIIHNVRSAHNVGSLLRSADGMGVSYVYMTGYTPAPIDRFGRKDSRIEKVSLGAENFIPWEQGIITNVITSLKGKQFEIVSLEQTTQSIPLHTYIPKDHVTLIVGNEINGVSDDALKESDVVVEIPMYGEKESLNVSNAGSIALHHIRHA